MNNNEDPILEQENIDERYARDMQDARYYEEQMQEEQLQAFMYGDAANWHDDFEPAVQGNTERALNLAVQENSERTSNLAVQETTPENTYQDVVEPKCDSAEQVKSSSTEEPA